MLTLDKRLLVVLAVLTLILLAALFMVVRLEMWQHVQHVLTSTPGVFNRH